MSQRKTLVKALREICAIAPACSAEADGMNIRCARGRGCEWRDQLRDAQRIARAALRALGETE